jgi:hypothetical protein
MEALHYFEAFKRRVIILIDTGDGVGAIMNSEIEANSFGNFAKIALCPQKGN